MMLTSHPAALGGFRMRREPSEEGDKPRSNAGAEAAGAKAADQDHLRELQRARQAKLAKAIIILLLLILFIIFIISNSAGQPVDFVFFTREPPLIWVMLACAVIGGIIGYLIGRPGKQIRLHRRERREQ
jgi:uncharacterized integral membrane protein